MTLQSLIFQPCLAERRTMDDITLKKYMDIWFEESLKEKPLEKDDAGHLSETELYGLAVNGGLDRADEKLLAHFSLCPHCMTRWELMREAVTESIDEDKQKSPASTEENIIFFGMLEAAAGGAWKPVSFIGASGKLKLKVGIYPNVDNAEVGLVTIELFEKDPSLIEKYENTNFVFREKGGKIILQGRMKNGQLSGFYEGLSEVDLSCFTIM